MKYLLTLILAIATTITGTFGYQNMTAKTVAPQVYGTTANMKFAQLQPYAIYGAGATAGATSITLKSMKDIDGNALTMSGTFGTKGFGTIEPGNGNLEEQISFTGLTNNSNGTVTLTGISSVSFTYPYTETSGLSKTHAGSTTFVISNTSGFYNQLTSTQNDETINGVYTFSSTSQPVYDGAPTFTNPLALIDKFYVDNVVVSGAPNADTVTKGIVQLATALQAASSTTLGSTGASDVLRASYATDTPNTGTRTSNVLMSDLTGDLKQGWLNLSQLFTFTGGLTSTATTTLAGSNVLSNAIVLNGVPYSFPSTLLASSSVLSIDTAGNTTWETPTAIRYTYATTTGMGIGNSSYATSTTLTIPAGVLTASSTIEVILDANMAVSAGSPTCDIFLKDSNSNVFFDMSIPATRAIFRTVIMGNNSASSQVSINPTLGNAFTSSINLAAGVSFLLVDRGNYTGGATGVCNLNDAQIIVTR